MHYFVRLLALIANRRLYRSLSLPAAHHERQLHKVIRYLARTQYVRTHGGVPNTYADFVERFPVVTYESISPYIERSLAGEKNVLVPGSIHAFAKSSGTTNAKSKYIPLNKKSLQANHYVGGRAVVAWAIDQYQLYAVPFGKTLGISGSFSAVPGAHPKTVAGDISAFLQAHLPRWARSCRFPPRSIATLADWNQKRDWICAHAHQHDIRSIAGTPTWVLRILEGIRDTGAAVADVWPRLQLFIHGAVAFGPYKESFMQLTKGLSVQLVEAYNATEGFFAFGDATTNGMYLLTQHGVFFEFVPKGQWHAERPNAIPLWEVTTGVDYALVITGYNGLVRYMVGDVVRFTGTDPYTIEIVGRTKHAINVFGEEVLGSQLEQALTHACTQTAARITAFTVAPFFSAHGKGSHEWLIEFEQAPNSNEDFVTALDAYLQSLNSDYEAKRNGSGILGMPKITHARAGAFLKYLQVHNKLGGQYKIPVVTNNRELLEEILVL